ncbi:hypothetical protein THRCLA_07892 [Thraustotheca clavata]|uniref:Uncharacterized protein n=1 Tax=Thraustotheca clavata TaxID=74557 RepID=A0A1V9ZBM8_9STRA|nr:hypothetical protein THRCLA_07892 [Thraustotheca clavata]
MTTSQPLRCSFNNCNNVVDTSSKSSLKCYLHRFRHKCRIPNCPNQVYARQLCVRHGGKKLCEQPGCLSNARSGPFCSKHGKAPTTLCSVQGCTRAAHLMRRCIRHGGGKQCIVDDCQANARARGVCWKHRFQPLPLLKHAFTDDDQLIEWLQEWIENDADMTELECGQI